MGQKSLILTKNSIFKPQNLFNYNKYLYKNHIIQPEKPTLRTFLNSKKELAVSLKIQFITYHG
jgi:hypothetical protein